MAISTFDLFTVGIGPSSSHTVGPMRAALQFVEALADTGRMTEVTRVQAEMYGSLGATGKGHGTAKAVLLGFEGDQPESVDVPSIAERMIMKGCRWRPADRSAGSRVAGKNEVHRRLQIDPYTEAPRMTIFSNCTQLIADLPSLPIDKANAEDVDTKVKNDHTYDALRYGLMSRPRSASIFDYNPSSQRVYQPTDKTFGY